MEEEGQFHSVQMKKLLTAIYNRGDLNDLLTGLELVRRKAMTAEQLQSYAKGNTIYLGDFQFGGAAKSLDQMETLARRGLPFPDKLLHFFSAGMQSTTVNIGFSISDFMHRYLSEKQRLPTNYDLEKAVHDACISKDYTPDADNWMTFAIFFDADQEGREGWHYGLVVGIDEHITRIGGVIDFALNLMLQTPTWSDEKFPGEQDVVEDLRIKSEIENYPNMPIIEAKSYLAADFIRYHVIAERARSRETMTIPNHPLNFLEKEG